MKNLKHNMLIILKFAEQDKHNFNQSVAAPTQPKELYNSNKCINSHTYRLVYKYIYVYICLSVVCSNNDHAHFIAYSIIQWQLSVFPIHKCQWAIKCVMSCSYRRTHTHTYYLHMYNKWKIWHRAPYNATSLSYGMQLMLSGRCGTTGNGQLLIEFGAI